MLTISQPIMDALQAVRLRELAERIAGWLDGELPAWSQSERRLSELQAILQAGHAAGMRVEMDYALFALLLLSSGGDWPALLSEPIARETMANADVSAPSKLLWLEGRLEASGHRLADAA